ncbi:hypothetical protein [Psychromicrobium sp. YIM B11713]|uniref:hypothetical protein n=1 Tax=Psychromicrobium sp. YIM B11713 TaxID=3145233 RepID=UPI00374E4FEF
MPANTPYYQFPYIEPSDQITTIPATSKAQAQRYEQALKDANVPPGNPDVTAILTRLNNLETIRDRTPRREAAGSGTITVSGTNGSINVTFPPGRFTVPPIVMVTRQTGTNANHGVYAEAVTKDGCKITMYYGPGGGTGTTQVAWHAIQFTDTTANG